MSFKNNAFATRQNYIRGVRALILHFQRLPENCSVEEIIAYLVHQRDHKNFSSSTVNLRVCGLKYYFRFVAHRLDLVVKIPNPRVQKYDTEILTLEEINLPIIAEDYLQTDGYIVYDKIAKTGSFDLVGCWAHAKRKFFEAKNFDLDRSSYVLKKIKTIYLHQNKSRDFTAEERKRYRLQNTAPLMHELHDWAQDNEYKVLPKSPIGKAIGYLLKQWKKLSRVLEDGKLELDNNQIENKIRPLALGRKNYLFAGNHQSGQNIAMFYSFFATCKEHNVNPYDWLKDVLEKISDTKITDLEELLPQYWSTYQTKETTEN